MRNFFTSWRYIWVNVTHRACPGFCNARHTVGVGRAIAPCEGGHAKAIFRSIGMKPLNLSLAAVLVVLPQSLIAQVPVPVPSTGQPLTGASSAAPRPLPDGVFRFGGLSYRISKGKAALIHAGEKVGDLLVAEQNGRVTVKGGESFILQEGQHLGMDGKLSPGPFDTTAPGILGSPRPVAGGDRDSSSGAPLPKPADTPKESRTDSTGNAPSSGDKNAPK